MAEEVIRLPSPLSSSPFPDDGNFNRVSVCKTWRDMVKPAFFAPAVSADCRWFWMRRICKSWKKLWRRLVQLGACTCRWRFKGQTMWNCVMFVWFNGSTMFNQWCLSKPWFSLMNGWVDGKFSVMKENHGPRSRSREACRKSISLISKHVISCTIFTKHTHITHWLFEPHLNL